MDETHHETQAGFGVSELGIFARNHGITSYQSQDIGKQILRLEHWSSKDGPTIIILVGGFNPSEMIWKVFVELDRFPK